MCQAKFWFDWLIFVSNRILLTTERNSNSSLSPSVRQSVSHIDHLIWFGPLTLVPSRTSTGTGSRYTTLSIYSKNTPSLVKKHPQSQHPSMLSKSTPSFRKKHTLLESKAIWWGVLNSICFPCSSYSTILDTRPLLAATMRAVRPTGPAPTMTVHIRAWRFR